MPTEHAGGARGDAPAILALVLFAAAIAACIAQGVSLVWALVFGWVDFAVYGHSRGIPFSQMPAMAWRSVCKVRIILAIFVMIGTMTGLWRLSGTIAQLVDWALPLIDPRFFSLWCFVLCGALSTLIGTSFGTVSTLGVICMVMARAGGFDPTLAAGAVVSGIYVGDRCSPMSSSASLVAIITQTDIYANFRRMLKSAAVPLVASAALYGALSYFEGSAGTLSAEPRFAAHFAYGLPVVLPAALVVVLALARVPVLWVMGLSAAAAAAVAIFVQGAAASECLRVALWGFEPQDRALAMLSGGGIVSMVEVGLVVAVSSSYGELFERSKLLACIGRLTGAMARAIGPFRTCSLVGLLTACLACNQTLASILTENLCRDIQKDRAELAMYIENGTIVLSAAVPWCIAYSMPAMVLGIGNEAIPYAFYIWMLPLFWWLMPARARQS